MLLHNSCEESFEATHTYVLHLAQILQGAFHLHSAGQATSSGILVEPSPVE
jgi:hypothetical protein